LQCEVEGVRIILEDIRVVPPSKDVMVTFVCKENYEA